MPDIPDTPDVSTTRLDETIVLMLADFVRNGNLRLNWNRYQQTGLSRRRIQRYRKKAVEIYSYYPSIRKEVSDQRIEIEKCKLKADKLTMELNSYKKSFDDTVDISARFHK